jgi:PTS system ascorbate-specific IIA component
MNGILIIAHAPLAHAMRECLRHVFPDSAAYVQALDVQPSATPDEILASGRMILAHSGTQGTLVLADIFGATPCNVAQRLVDGVDTRLIAGVNLPMVLRAWSYRHESLDAMATRALAGGSQGVMPVAVTAPQNQTRRNHAQDQHDHQQ